jgi:hypothetical protein
MKPMTRTWILPCSIMLALLLSGTWMPTAAESVFLKDGTIIEGSLLSRDQSEVTLVLPNKVKVSVPAGEVIRIAHNDDYKKPAVLRMKDGTVRKGHIVAEDERTITLRAGLDSAGELVLGRESIKEIKRGADAVGDQKPPVAFEITPGNAAKYSIIPIQSGSFLVETNGWGAFFCFAKTGGLILPMAVMLGGSGGTSDSSESSNPLENNEKLQRMVYISMGVWAIATAFDAVYSYYYVKNHLARNTAVFGFGEETSFSLVPRLRAGYEAHAGGPPRPDGIDAMASMRF